MKATWWGEPTKWLYPASHLLRLDGREPVRALLPDDDAYAAVCDRLECLASYVAVDAAREPSRHVPWMGEFILDGRSDGDGNGLVAQDHPRNRRGMELSRATHSPGVSRAFREPHRRCQKSQMIDDMGNPWPTMKKLMATDEEVLAEVPARVPGSSISRGTLYVTDHQWCMVASNGYEHTGSPGNT